MQNMQIIINSFCFLVMKNKNSIYICMVQYRVFPQLNVRSRVSILFLSFFFVVWSEFIFSQNEHMESLRWRIEMKFHANVHVSFVISNVYISLRTGIYYAFADIFEKFTSKMVELQCVNWRFDFKWIKMTHWPGS